MYKGQLQLSARHIVLTVSGRPSPRASSTLAASPARGLAATHGVLGSTLLCPATIAAISLCEADAACLSIADGGCRLDGQGGYWVTCRSATGESTAWLPYSSCLYVKP